MFCTYTAINSSCHQIMTISIQCCMSQIWKHVHVKKYIISIKNVIKWNFKVPYQVKLLCWFPPVGVTHVLGFYQDSHTVAAMWMRTAVFPEVLLVQQWNASARKGNEKPAVILSSTCSLSIRSDVEMWFACCCAVTKCHSSPGYHLLSRKEFTRVDRQESRWLNTSFIWL